MWLGFVRLCGDAPRDDALGAGRWGFPSQQRPVIYHRVDKSSVQRGPCNNQASQVLDRSPASLQRRTDVSPRVVPRSAAWTAAKSA